MRHTALTTLLAVALADSPDPLRRLVGQALRARRGETVDRALVQRTWESLDPAPRFRLAGGR